MDKKIKLIYTGAFAFVFLMIVGLLLFSNFVLAGSFDEEDTRQIGYEFLDSDSVVHIWNTQDDYFFEKDAGIQLTNHYEDYWTRNIFCIGYYSGEEWIKIKCADELTNFEKSIETDDETYVNATLWKNVVLNIEGNNYDFRLAINYYLGLNDENLSITMSGKNTGIDIPVDLGFAWKIKDVNVPPEPTDKIIINGSEYELDGIYDLNFKNMTQKYKHTNWNETCLEECNTNWNETCLEECGVELCVHCLINQTDVYEPIPFYKMYDRETGLSGKENFLRVDWNANLDYTVKLYSDGSQESSYVALLIDAGHFNPGQEKSTTFQWIDALTDNLISYYKLDESSGNAEDSHGSNTGTVVGVDYSAGGKINTAFNFITLSDYVDFGTTAFSFDYNTPFSISLWFRGDATQGQDYNVIYSKINTGNPYQGTFISASIDNNYIHYVMRTAVGGDFIHVRNAVTLNTLTWYHIVVTYDGSSDVSGLNIYVNDTLTTNNVIENTLSSTINNGPYPARIGAWPGIRGIVDEWAAWSRELTSEEVTELWNDGDGFAYSFDIPTCTFAGYVFDENNNALEGANVTVFNQFDVTEYYEDTTNASGYWAVNITSSTNTYMASAYFNNTLIGQLKPYILGTC